MDMSRESKKTDSKKTERLVIMVEPELRQALDAKSASSGVLLSELVRRAIIASLEKKDKK